jgi:hypothetical protein
VAARGAAAAAQRWAGSGRLVVFDPEHRHGVVDDYTGQVEWEERCLHLADVVLFWVPRELSTMPAFTTNVEWGMWYDSGRVVFGAPPGAPKNRYLLHYAAKHGVPSATTLDGTVGAALSYLGTGYLFSVELTAEELEPLRAGGAHGNLTESERTFPEVTTFGEIRDRRLVDWATLGMLTQVLSAQT